MKKFVGAAAAVLVLGASSVALAENVGCGVGNTIFPNADTTLKQILAVTTNGILGNQTFGISSGTVGCEKPATFASTPQLERFVAANMDALARDIALGSGEALATVAELLKVPAGERAKFNEVLKANFTKIYPTAGVQPGEVIDAIVGVIS